MGNVFKLPFRISLGAIALNLVSRPIVYDSGHTEEWTPEAIIGFSAALGDLVCLALDVATDGGIRAGVEYIVAQHLGLRVGIRHEGEPILSWGVGVALHNVELDLAMTVHERLGSQIRGTISAHWSAQ